MLKCYACDLSIHARCANVSDSIVSELGEEKGLHFYCDSHRSISVSKLLKTISRLQSFHVELKMLTDQYKEVLEMTSVSELRKIDAVKKPSTASPNPDSLRLHRSKRQYDSSYDHKKNNKRTKNMNDSKSKVSPTSVPSHMEVGESSISVVPSSPIDVSNANQRSFSSVVKQPVLQNRDVEVIEDKVGFSFSAVPPVKKIFVSRLPPDITTEVIKEHILTRLNKADVFLNIIKLPMKEGASYSSMILNVGHNHEVFDKIVSSSFWPPYTIVHEDVPREQRSKNQHLKN